MQQLWEMGYDWDQALPPEICQKWIELFKELEELNGVTFPCCLTPVDAVGFTMLCVFSDSSRQAFGACVYVRWLTNNGRYEARFVAAKSRVAPLKELTIPLSQITRRCFSCAPGKKHLRRSTYTVREGHILHGQSNCISMDPKPSQSLQAFRVSKSWRNPKQL